MGIWEDEIKERNEIRRINVRAILAEKSAVLVEAFDLLSSATAKAAEAEDAEKVARAAYTVLLAEAAGLKIGSRVTRTRDVGWRPNRKIQVQTFEVTRISLEGFSDLYLYGKTVLKNGALGETHNIGISWELVKQPSGRE